MAQAPIRDSYCVLILLLVAVACRGVWGQSRSLTTAVKYLDVNTVWLILRSLESGIDGRLRVDLMSGG